MTLRDSASRIKIPELPIALHLTGSQKDAIQERDDGTGEEPAESRDLEAESPKLLRKLE
jgi:hypothetical protein